MASRAKTAPAKKHMRQPRTSPLDSTSIVKSLRARKSLRLQKPPVFHVLQVQPIQSLPAPPTFISQPAGIKRKRSHDSQAEAEVEVEVDERKAERPAKQPRRSVLP